MPNRRTRLEAKGPYTGKTGAESKGMPADVRVLRQPSRQPGSQPGMNGRHGLTQPMKSPTGAVGAGQKGLEGTVRWQPRPSNDTQCELQGMVGNYRVSHLKVGEPRLTAAHTARRIVVRPPKGGGNPQAWQSLQLLEPSHCHPDTRCAIGHLPRHGRGKGTPACLHGGTGG